MQIRIATHALIRAKLINIYLDDPIISLFIQHQNQVGTSHVHQTILIQNKLEQGGRIPEIKVTDRIFHFILHCFHSTGVLKHRFYEKYNQIIISWKYLAWSREKTYDTNKDDINEKVVMPLHLNHYS